MSFFNLGPEKSKELINLFRKIKVKLSNNVFENEVFIFYLCIDDMSFFKLLSLLDRNNFDDWDRDNFDNWPILIYQKFRAAKKNLKFRLGNYSARKS
ncbi:P52 family lipoprotein [Borreliella burgdorferi]|uniref:Outer membrane protein n=1 Tax=Borreliella burgdorferi 297 TaxID=521009 RepID=A0A9N7AMZ2_BORBG|nr:P52 family lipoprotein [Borreliella burgdorferi]ADQ44543.1 outer membrane protein [Borreliella burgdorferi 297]MCD2322096.1 P52 family lipoprotein [Borreliella burgdorferi]MCD2409705.1 P52 family lipoprotein [Borreliella burgdorferi]MCD2415730.1 P52 family lipoprotein [Borreliella burgdorferi]MCR8909924.1 P52 family lipoprotein [Borreliella burgdorferi 297]